MIYVISDIHGKFDKFTEMLEKIRFSKKDTLYIVGDMVDRGEKPMEVVWYANEHENIIPLMGNHDMMAHTILGSMQIEDSLPMELQLTLSEQISFWVERNGGGTTLAAFLRLSSREKDEFLSILYSLPYYKELDIGDKHYILVHAGLPNYTPDKPLSSYTNDELVWTRPDFDVKLKPAKLRIIIGHTPTLTINNKAEIYHGKTYINIDCGACFPEGRLACMCLDTGEEFYV